MRRMARYTVVILAAAAWVGATAPAGAVVTLKASRAEVLYSADDEPDCSTLFSKLDGELPFNVVRLRVQIDGVEVPPDTQVKWSFPEPAVGILAADEDLGTSDTSSGIVGFCAEFGNECVLTKQKLAFYTKPTILWLGPTCDQLPDDTERAFPGGTVKFRVKVPKVGKARVNVGYGHMGSARLSVTDVNGQFQTGIGKPDGVLIPFNPVVAATVDFEGHDLPALDTLQFDSGAGDSLRAPPNCENGCGEFKYASAGRFVPTLTARLADESALCDRLRCRSARCESVPKLEIITTPRRQTYRSGQSVRLRVRLHNRSPRENGCDFSLAGKVLSCTADLKAGGIVDTHNGDLSYQRCSATATQPCETNADCECTETNCPCQDCVPDEFCITYSHCSQTITKQCASDGECHPPVCPECREDEHCVDVIPKARDRLNVGQSIDLLDTTISLKNSLPDVAAIKETWTATTEDGHAGGDSADLKYRIRGTR